MSYKNYLLMKHKLNLLTLVLLLFITTGHLMSQATLTHSYTFEDGTANDVVGTVNGTLQGTATVESGALVLDANGDYVSFDGVALDLNSYSAITMEYYFSSPQGVNDGHWNWTSYFGASDGSNNMMVALNVWDEFRMKKDNGPQIQTPDMDDGLIHHAVAVMTADRIKIYLDGILMAETSVGPISIGTDIAYLGNAIWPDPTWMGSVYEFNIYNGELTAADVLDSAMAIPEVSLRDAHLSALTLSSGTLFPDFKMSGMEYAVVIPDAVTSIDIGGTAVNPGATVTGATVDVSSGSAKDTVKVTSEDGLTTNNYIVYFTTVTDGCFVPLKTDGNLVGDPELTDLTNFGGWGTKKINVDPAYVYCGLSSGMVISSGSIDVNPIAFEPNTTYRLKAQVYTEGGTFRIGVDDGSGSEIFAVLTTLTDQWETIDVTFTTTAGAGTGLMYFNNWSLTGTLGVIDNWELYRAPKAFTPQGPWELNNLKNVIQDGDTIALLSPSDLAVDSTYTLTATFGISGKSITICPANSANGMPYINGANNTFQLKNGSLFVDNIEYFGGKYFLQPTGDCESIEITNSKFEKIARGVITAGGYRIENALVDNCIIINSGNSDNNPLLGSSSTSGFYGSFVLSNSTLTDITGPVVRITTKTTDPSTVLIDHCTLDSIGQGSTASPFFITSTDADLTGNEVRISNNVITNVIGCSSLWSRITAATPDAVIVESTSYWHVGVATDSAVAANATLAATYVNADPQYTAYTPDVATRDFTLNNTTLYTLGTDGGKIGDPRWKNRIPIVYTPQGPVELNQLVTIIMDGDIIELLSPADLAVDSTYALTSTFNIGNNSLTVRPANIANGKPFIDGSAGNFQTSTGSFYFDNIEYSGGNYVLRVSGNVDEIEITNCHIENVSRGVILQTSGGRNINSAVIDNCVIYNSGGGDNNALFGTSTTSGYYGSFQLTNSTLSVIKGPVFRITHKLEDDTKIIVNHCTLDSIYGTTSPFYTSTNVADLTGNEVTISNTVITNLVGCTSIWERMTIGTPDAQNVEATSYWMVGAAVDSAASTVVTLATSYMNADPMYTDYTVDRATRDFSINNPTLLTLGTDGGIIGDPRWTNHLPSSDASLSALTVDVGTLTPDFSPDTEAYTVSVPSGTTSVTVSATATHPNASVSGDGAVDVSSGSGTATIVVTAEDGVTTRTYTVDITVESVVTADITFIVDDSQGQTYTGFALKGSWNTATGEYDASWSGGAEHTVFYDDGTNGDVTAGDHIWTVTLTLVSDGGANTWEWGFNDDAGNWIPDANQQFTVPDGTAQTLTPYVIPVVVVTADITFVVDDSQGQTYTGFALKGSWNTATGVYDAGWSGGAEHTVFYDDGTNGDATAGDHIWSVTVTLVSDGGANTWEWGFNDDAGNWIPDANQQFTVPDGTPQTLTPYMIPVGIEQNALRNVSIYPNPAQSSLIVTNAEGATISICDLNGRMLKVQNNAPDVCEMDLNGMSQGVYLIKIQSEKGVYVSRFIKE